MDAVLTAPTTGGTRRWVHLMFATGSLLLVLFLYWTIDWVWGYFERPNPLLVQGAAVLLGGAGGLVAWRHPVLFGLASEVAVELRKVTWPTREETKWGTIVVIVTVAIASIFLGVYDMIWSWATDLLYS